VTLYSKFSKTLILSEFSGAFPTTLGEADGLWRLVYSSALSAGSGSGGGASGSALPMFQTPDTGSFNSFGPGSQVFLYCIWKFIRQNVKKYKYNFWLAAVAAGSKKNHLPARRLAKSTLASPRASSGSKTSWRSFCAHPCPFYRSSARSF
jgi:hypothetical protein